MFLSCWMAGGLNLEACRGKRFCAEADVSSAFLWVAYAWLPDELKASWDSVPSVS